MFRNSTLLVLALLAVAACTSPPPKPQATLLNLSRSAFADLPDWNTANADAALAAFRRSCAVLTAKPDTAPMSGTGYAGTVADWRAPCADAGGEAKAFFEKNFTPYAVGGDTGLFTGYYEPQIRGSRKKTDIFQTPVYGLPPDLVRVDLSLFDPKFAGEHVSGRLDGPPGHQRLVPFATRAEIDAHGVANTKILFWCDDPVALFFLQIQGSGRVRFAEGGSERIGYAGENGKPYTAIGRVLIAEGALARENVSLASIGAWLKKNPARARSVMEADQSFIFFEEKPVGDPALGNEGTLGAALTPLASLAIDPRIHALAAPYYVDAAQVAGLLIGQDTGGAIRGAVRGDIFFGFGDKAEADAGNMKADGMLYVLLPNALAVKLGKQKDLL